MINNRKPTAPDPDLIRYFPNGAVQINLDNILTTDKIIFPNMLLLKVEGSHYDVIKVLDIWDEDGVVYLKILDRKTGRIGRIGHVLDPEIKYFIWWLVSYEYVMDHMENNIVNISDKVYT